ncbi:hypothetical protein [Amycolatopsis aidingensis]|uniref:hypothetical protein n=1 Tax=Amycolatopsis aidingensis TaxID=2842453 RepID=UPI001C0BFE70|nr:hypothetical protein [Amycolatopsis aidingensis]
MKARIIAVLATTAAVFGLMTSPAHAYGRDFTRTCDGEKTTYTAYTTNDGDYAYTRKNGGHWASCKGHAWVRIKMGGHWYAWKHDSHVAKIDGTAPIQMAQHKGCSTCHVYTTAPL